MVLLLLLLVYGLLSFVAITYPRASYEKMPVQCSQAVN